MINPALDFMKCLPQSAKPPPLNSINVRGDPSGSPIPTSATGVAVVNVAAAPNQFHCITLSIWERIFIISSSDKYDNSVQSGLL